MKALIAAVQLAQQRAASDLHRWPVKDLGSTEHQSLQTAHRIYGEALLAAGAAPKCFMAREVAKSEGLA